VLASAREASCLPCVTDLPRFVVHSFYYVLTTEAPLGLLRVRPPPCDHCVGGWVHFFSLSLLFFWLLRSLLLAALMFTPAS
jgi:hypothetical protein